MNWKYKTIAQNIFSYLPGGENLNYISQKHITKNLPLSKKKFTVKVMTARNHFDINLKYNDCETHSKAIFYEFGAGWDMIIPLSYCLFGVDSQIIIDIRPLLKVELVNDTLKKFRMYQKELETLFSRKPDKQITFISSKNATSQLKEHFGITYKAPCDARNSRLKSNSIDFISSTVVLEHIPMQNLFSIFKECYRILKNDGIMSCIIDFKDHYSYFDRSISVYNFLRYSESIWKLFNPPLHYQNRLRYNDYIEMIKNSGFKIVEDVHKQPSDEDIRELKKIRIHNQFKHKYSLINLAIRRAHLVLKKG